MPHIRACIHFLLFCLVSSLVLNAPAWGFPANASDDHPVSGEDWQSLLRQQEPDKAEALCGKLLQGKDAASRVEGRKCMANTILYRSRTGAPATEGQPDAHLLGWSREGADQAIEELEQAMRLAPDDLSLHQMRLFVLLRSGQAEKAPQALEDSLTRYKGPESFDHWLSFSREFWTAKQYEAGLQYLKILESKYPDNPSLFGNMAAFAAEAERPGVAGEYARKAVAMQPDNPRHHWNLAGLYTEAGELDKADASYQKALSLFTDKKTADAAWCSYAEFVQNSLQDAARAEEIRSEHCSKATAQ